MLTSIAGAAVARAIRAVRGREIVESILKVFEITDIDLFCGSLILYFGDGRNIVAGERG